MIDWNALHLDPLYAALGVPAVVTLSESGGDVDVTVIDKTAGVQLGEGDVQVDTLTPACCIRASEWAAQGQTVLDFEDAKVTFNGSRWDIKGFPKRPTPAGGSSRGEILLILSNETVVDLESSS